jgi:hypothetical protein
MIEDLIEGIACYCDTEDKCRALLNVSYSFNDWINKGKDYVKEHNPFKSKSNQDDEDEALRYRVKKSNDWDHLAAVNQKYYDKIVDRQNKLDSKKLKDDTVKKIIPGVGAVGGVGIGVLIGDKIAKKKGWDTRKGKVIGGLLGGVAGAGLGYGAGAGYNKFIDHRKHKAELDDVSNYGKVVNPLIKDYESKYGAPEEGSMSRYEFNDYKNLWNKDRYK